MAHLSGDTGLDPRKSSVHHSPLQIIFKKEAQLKSLQATQQPSPTSPRQFQDVLQPARKQGRDCAEQEHQWEGRHMCLSLPSSGIHYWKHVLTFIL